MENVDFEKFIHLRLLLSVEGIGPSKLLNLLSSFKTLDEIYSAGTHSLVQVRGITESIANKIQETESIVGEMKNRLGAEFERLGKMNAKVISFWDKEYPNILKRIYSPPIILYALGKFTQDDAYSVAMVGTRQPTNYGKAQAEKLAKELTDQQISIVSGMARGIDSTAHRAALGNNGRTIAVIGSGLDVIYPSENKKLFSEIAEKGVVISEYVLGTKPDAQNFPRRNRIISGLSLGTVVVESGLNGGAMQTAAHALDQNREVFAIPGNLGIKQSEGTNLLIQRGGAKLVQSAEDILVELNLKLKPEAAKSVSNIPQELTLFEQKVFDVLSPEPIHIDQIAELASQSTSDCLVQLLTLEFKGVIRQLPGKMFSLI